MYEEREMTVSLVSLSSSSSSSSSSSPHAASVHQSPPSRVHKTTPGNVHSHATSAASAQSSSRPELAHNHPCCSSSSRASPSPSLSSSSRLQRTMADRVHPAPPHSSSSPPHQPDDQRAGAVVPPATATETTPLQEQHPSFARPAAPPPGTYIVQVPKDQVLRVPPPDRARRYKKLAYSRPARRRALRRACCCACAAVLLLLALAAAFVGAVYLVYRPRAPSFSVASLSIHGLNATALALGGSSSSGLSPRLDATVRADNARNRKVGIEYRGGGAVAVSYDAGGARLAEGPWPAFRQPPRNVTAFAVAMAGQGVRLTEAQAARIVQEQAAGAVPLQVEADVSVRLRFGGVLRTWTVDVRARCDVAVDRLDGDAVAVNRGCRVKVRPLWWWW